MSFSNSYTVLNCSSFAFFSRALRPQCLDAMIDWIRGDEKQINNGIFTRSWHHIRQFAEVGSVADSRWRSWDEQTDVSAWEIRHGLLYEQFWTVSRSSLITNEQRQAFEEKWRAKKDLFCNFSYDLTFNVHTFCHWPLSWLLISAIVIYFWYTEWLFIRTDTRSDFGKRFLQPCKNCPVPISVSPFGDTSGVG